MTTKQQKDLETILYFIPESMKGIKITNKDIEKFFEYSDQELSKEVIEVYLQDWGYNEEEHMKVLIKSKENKHE